MTLALLHELLELAALGTLILGGICLVAGVIYVLLLAWGLGEEKPVLRPPGWEAHAREGLAWLESEPAISTYRPVDYKPWLEEQLLMQESTPHPYNWASREPMIWGAS